MRIGCLQFAPQVGDVDNNLNRADAVLSRSDVEELDLLVLPELAFTGYNFRSLQEIAPFLEPSGSGITSLWARTIALKYDCTVVAGYPEKVDVTPKWPTSPEYYNSAIVVNPDGKTIANYRKSFLYYTDQTWALEGDGFYSGFLPRLGHAAMGICMDLNPYKFEAPWNDYEFAMHALQVRANLVIVSMAWMTREEPRQFSRMPNEPDLDTLTYWVTRLEPLIRAERSGEVIVVFANRCGIEGDATYAGTSAVIGIEDGEVTVYGLLGRGSKELLVVDTSHPPYGKLVHRPESTKKTSAPNDQVEDSATGGREPGHQTSRPSEQNNSPSDASPGPHSPEQHEKDQPITEHPESYQGEINGGDTPIAIRGTQNITQRETTTDQIVEDEDIAGVELDGNLADYIGDIAAAMMSEPDELSPTKLTIAPLSIPEASTLISPTDTVVAGEGNTPIATIPQLYSPRTAVRPRLVIPQSPTMMPEQLYSDQPFSAASAASAMSGRSIQSIKSNDSELSIQTIRSNPRPPEDSTPYPHSGLPLSGYPARKQIYGGFVAFDPEDSNFAPITPFDDMLPNSAVSWHWPLSANPFGNLHSAGGYRTNDFAGHAPEPYPWSSMRGASRTRTRTRSRSTRRMHMGNSVRQPTPPVTNNYAATDIYPGSDAALDEWKAVSGNFEPPKHDPDAASSRPTSPKSRNASRSRLQERPGSAMGRPDFSAAAFHLENVSKRVSSISRTRERGEHSETESYFDAESSSESRSISPEKDKNISIGPEPYNPAAPVFGILNPVVSESNRKMMVPTPVALDYYRSASNPATLNGSPSISSTGMRVESRTVSRTRLHDDTAGRSVSRGRQRDAKPSPVMPEPNRESRVRSTSIDSTRNDLLHRQVRRPSANGGSHLSRNQSRNTINGNILLPEGYVPEDFERVEEISCPNCPVHGRSASATSNHVGNDSNVRVGSQNRPRRRRSTSQGLGSTHQLPSHEVTGLQLWHAPLEMRQLESEVTVEPQVIPERRTIQERRAIPESRNIPEPRFAPAAVQRPKRGYNRVKRSFAASPIPRPSTAPLPFNPPTPKAMAFIPLSDELDSLDEDDFALPTTTIKGKFVEKGKRLEMELPMAA